MASHNLVASSQANEAGRISIGRVALMGLIAVIASIIANLAVLFLAQAIFTLPADFPPLQAGAIAVLTGVGVGLGAVVFAVMTRFAKEPVKLFRSVAIIALIVSIIPNIALAVNPAAAPFPGGTAFDFLLLIIFHIVAAVICIGILTTQTRSKR